MIAAVSRQSDSGCTVSSEYDAQRTSSCLQTCVQKLLRTLRTVSMDCHVSAHTSGKRCILAGVAFGHRYSPSIRQYRHCALSEWLSERQNIDESAVFC